MEEVSTTIQTEWYLMPFGADFCNIDIAICGDSLGTYFTVITLYLVYYVLSLVLLWQCYLEGVKYVLIPYLHGMTSMGL
jgi:hypothetical protein